ncbi:MAG: HAMP domain-containing sensor histidine kinase [Spongiibacteraceae bacterium]
MPSDLAKLAALIIDQRSSLLADWRQQVRELPSAKHLDTPTLNDHIPQLLDELADAFRKISDEGIAESLLTGSPPEHGAQRLQDGFDIEEVVAEYNILRGCIHDLAGAHGLSLQGKPFHIMNRVFDGAIGLAVQTYTTQQAAEVRRRREDYLAFVAHDLRTPLNAIALASTVLESILNGQAANPDIAMMLKTLKRNVHQLDALVRTVLEENTHLEADVGIKLVRREVYLWPLVELLIHDLHPIADAAGTKLVNQVPDELTIYADAALLRRIFQNLITNAIQFAPQGQVAIGAKSLDHGSVECFVSDNGVGVAPNRLDVIFDKLETDSEATGAHGLGLYIVKSYVEAHDSKVSVVSTLGAGSTFTFALPEKP